jgi:hypothetical protein
MHVRARGGELAGIMRCSGLIPRGRRRLCNERHPVDGSAYGSIAIRMRGLPVVCGLGFLLCSNPIKSYTSELKLLRIDARNRARFPESTNYRYSVLQKD